MPSLLESVTDLLNGGDGFTTLGRLIGGSADQAEAATGAAVPAIIGGLAARASADDGPGVITGLLDQVDTGPLDDVGAFLDGGDATAGAGMLDGIFGKDRSGLVDGVAAKAEVDGSMITKLLPMLAPLVVGFLQKRRSEDKLDEAGVVGLLEAESEALDGDGLLDTIGDVLGGGVGTAAGAAAAVAGAGALLGAKAKDAAEGVGDVAGDAAAAVADAAGDAVGAVSDAAGDAVEAVADAAGDAKDAVASRLGEVKDAVSGGGVDDDRNGGLGWLWWALGAVVLVLLLAWLLSMCNDDSDSNATAGDSSAVVDDDGDESDEDGDEEDASSDAAGSTADQDGGESQDGDESEESEASGDGSDGSTDDSGPSEAELQAVLDAALSGSGVDAALSGGVVTLTGTAESERVRTDLITAIGSIDGVSSVVDEVEVAGDTSVGDEDGVEDEEATDDGDGGDTEPESGDTINELLDLDPVTFRVSSARITEDGEAVLDEAAAYLEDNPDVRIEIGGHTDDDGAVSENLTLSQLRADSVKDYLEAKGIDGDRMETVGYGEGEPKVPNDSSLAKAENRRIEFTIL